MINLKKFINEQTITAIIIVSIIAFPLLDFIGEIFGQQFFLQEEYLKLIGIIGVVGFSYFVISTRKQPKKIVLSDVFIITSILFCVISIIFSQSIQISLFGHKGYSESPLQVLGYFSLFLLGTTIKEESNKKKILTTFFILGIIEALVASMQYFKMWPFKCEFDTSWHTKDHLAFGFTQHCNFFAPIAVIFSSLFASKFIYDKKWWYLIGAVVCCFSAFFTQTRIAWVGIFAAMFGIMFLEIALRKKNTNIFKSNLKRYVIVLSCFILCFILTGKNSGQIEKDVAQSKTEVSSASSNFDNFGTGRGAIWKSGLQALSYHPFTGVGFDIYDYSFFMLNGDKGSHQNKGHNEYIHVLVTQGIFSGVNYLLFAFYCCYFPFRKILEGSSEFVKSNLTKMFLVALFAYFVQALFNSSVTNVAVYKWILMGLVLPRYEQIDFKDYKLVKKIVQISKMEIKL